MLTAASDYSGATTKMEKILLNGNNICMVRFLSFPSFHYPPIRLHFLSFDFHALDVSAHELLLTGHS